MLLCQHLPLQCQRVLEVALHRLLFSLFSLDDKQGPINSRTWALGDVEFILVLKYLFIVPLTSHPNLCVCVGGGGGGGGRLLRLSLQIYLSDYEKYLLPQQITNKPMKLFLLT